MKKQKMSEYKILTGSPKKLQKKVTEFLKEGWELFGDPFATGRDIQVGGDPAYPHTGTLYSEIAQAMLKYDLNKNN